MWKITAAQDAVSPPRWQATFDHTFPPESVAGLTAALASTWAPEGDRFLEPTSVYWAGRPTMAASASSPLPSNWRCSSAYVPPHASSVAPGSPRATESFPHEGPPALSPRRVRLRQTHTLLNGLE
ncbi:DUF317 domain-containing protein [Streptomyces sclerotialus]|uniref:DUF317 domain-containing protein n=1 Tax=Streptomyces sclerotialus TaxID=1957 RepID=UPI0034A22169